jgi:hypothetical protein
MNAPLRRPDAKIPTDLIDRMLSISLSESRKLLEDATLVVEAAVTIISFSIGLLSTIISLSTTDFGSTLDTIRAVVAAKNINHNFVSIK